MRQATARMRGWAGLSIALVLMAATAVVAAVPAAQAATLLYNDDFESDTVGGAAAGWNVSSGTWSVALDSTRVLMETNTNTATAKSINAGSVLWTDYALQAQIKPGTTALGTANVLAARYTDDNNSYALILKDGSTWYFGKKVGGVWTTLANGSFSYNTSSWYQLEVDVVGNKLTGLINGTKVASVTDSTFSAGAFAVMSRSTIEVDNVIVTQLAPPPPPSPSPSPSASPSPSPVPSPSPAPSPSPSPPPSNIPAWISGTVTIAGTSSPLAGVVVTSQPASASATTDSSGSYTLNVTSGTYNVIFNAQGFNANFAGAVSAPPNGTATANGALIPVTALAAQDLFSRPDQNGIGTASDGHAWAADYNVYPAAQVSISTGNLYIQTATQNTDHDTWMGIPYRDEEITADLYIVNVFQDPRFLHGGRLLARVQGSDSWIVMALNTVNDTLTIWVDNGGNWAQLGSASVQMSPNTWYHAKLDVVAGGVYGKAWAFGTAEPAWQVTGSQSAIISAGVGGLRCGAADVLFANYMEMPITQISGKVTDAATGTGLAGVTVSLSNGATTVTDAAGRYSFGPLTPGTYTVSAAPAPYNPGSTSATVSTGLSATGVNLALS